MTNKKPNCKIYAIRENRIVCRIDVAPFSFERLDRLCIEQGYDDWIMLDKNAALLIMGVGNE